MSRTTRKPVFRFMTWSDKSGWNVATEKGERLQKVMGVNYLCSEGSDKPLFLARLHEVQKSYCSHTGRTRSRSRSTLLKFSRSLYLDNQLSEGIHTWLIGIL